MEWCTSSLKNILTFLMFYLSLPLSSISIVDSSSLTPNSIDIQSQHLLNSCLYKLLPKQDQHQIKQHIRKKRNDDLIANLCNNPMENVTSLDKFIDTDHTYNLSSAEMEFYRQPTYEFHRRIFNRFKKWQKKVFNESMRKIQNELNAFAEIHHERKIPGKIGLKFVYEGLKSYRNEMMEWVRHTFVYKPKTLVREEKLRLECFLDNETLSLPQDKVRAFWVFERIFANMMDYYYDDMTSRIMEHYDKVLFHYIDMGEHLEFPKTCLELNEHLINNGDLYEIDVRNETTTYSFPEYTMFTLDPEQKKAAKLQGKNWSTDYDK